MRVRSSSYKKYRGTIFSSLLLIAAIFTLVWGILPSIMNIRLILSRVNELRKETSVLQKRLTFLDSLNETEMRDSLVELLIAVPFGRSIPTVLVTILDVSSQAQVNLSEFGVNSFNSVATAAAEAPDTNTDIPVSISLTAEKTAFRTFLENIQSVRRILSILNMNVSYEEDGTVEANMIVNGFSLPMLIGGIATDSGLPNLTAEEQSVISEISALPKYGSDLPQTPVKPAEVKPDPFQRF